MPIRYSISLLKERSDHPLLLGLFIAAVVLVIAGYGISQTIGSELTAGFLGVYAVMAVFIGIMGYCFLIMFRIYRKYFVTY